MDYGQTGLVLWNLECELIREIGLPENAVKTLNRVNRRL